MTPPTLPYRNLYDEAEKQKVIQAIRKIRRDVLQAAEAVPPDQWYTPRYHGWSLAGMLGHLQLVDRLAKWMMQASMVGIRLPVPLNVLNGFNDLMAPVLKNRKIETTRKGLERNEAWVIDFIEQLPPAKFDVPVYNLLYQEYVTLEQGVQLYYLFHWHHHYQTMRGVDGIFYEPPNQTVV